MLLFICLLALPATLSFPFVLDNAGVDSSLLAIRAGSGYPDPVCPNNPNHQPAAPVTAKHPYNHARNGLPGLGIGGYPVPAPGDTEHEYQEPGPLDIRGPCPGLNAASNHGFLARDGITTLNELIDAQQNVYNVAWDLAVVLAVAGMATDGDFLGTERLSIGCDATPRTASSSSSMDEPGLDAHNRFEADVSLTRNDYGTGPEPKNDYKYNNTLFTMMMDTCQGNCNLSSLSLYRYNRWQQSKRENGNFSFSVGQVLLYGAASFLYELFPSADNVGTGDELTMMSFFGANKDSNGNYYFNGGERIPPKWSPRVDAFGLVAAAPQVLEMYLEHPVPFGYNDGPNNFKPLDWTPYIQNGQLTKKTPDAMLCMLYKMLTEGYPIRPGQKFSLPAEVQSAVASRLDSVLASLAGCPTSSN